MLFFSLRLNMLRGRKIDYFKLKFRSDAECPVKRKGLTNFWHYQIFCLELLRKLFLPLDTVCHSEAPVFITKYG